MSLISDLVAHGSPPPSQHEHRYPPPLFKRVSADKESSKVQGCLLSPPAIRPSIPAAATARSNHRSSDVDPESPSLAALVDVVRPPPHASEVTTTQLASSPKKRSTSMPKSVSGRSAQHRGHRHSLIVAVKTLVSPPSSI
ncbi:hypothetical protein Dimus_012875 [Dionaea muscipula]